MENSKKTQAVDTNSKVMSEIVSYLKNYPFLLITVAGLLILAGILIFEEKKLELFSSLIYGVVLVPICLQFFLELKKQGTRNEKVRANHTGNHTKSVEVEGPVEINPQHFSRKVIASLVLLGLLFMAFVGAQDKLDTNFHIGALIVMTIPALLLSFSAMSDVRQGIVKGKGMAIATLSLSLVMTVLSLGLIGNVEYAKNDVTTAGAQQKNSQLQNTQPSEANASGVSKVSGDEGNSANDKAIAMLFRQSEVCAQDQRWKCVIDNSNNILELSPGNAKAQKMRDEAVKRRNEAMSSIVIK